jgi:hypothetical protein
MFSLCIPYTLPEQSPEWKQNHAEESTLSTSGGISPTRLVIDLLSEY